MDNPSGSHQLVCLSVRVNDIHVGIAYNYCVSAVKSHYMVNPDAEAEEIYLAGSYANCAPHTVKWVSWIA